MQEAESALQAIDAHDRKTWIECGMALKQEFGNQAFDVWDRWSATASNYDRESAKTSWRSFLGGAITIKTMYHYARQAGWKPDGTYKPPTAEERAERERIAKKRFTAEEKLKIAAQKQAATKAEKILKSCVCDTHQYLKNKGFADQKWNVLHRIGKEPLLCIPMLIDGKVSSVQYITSDGKKKFHPRGKADGAYFDIGHKVGQVWLCEGFATGLALRSILDACRVKYTVRICFSAQNILKVSKHDDFICADNDESGTGQRVALQSGCRFYLPDREGWDVCDELQADGKLKMMMKFQKWLTESKNAL